MCERVTVQQNFTPIEVFRLLTEIKDLKAAGYRFVQACATGADDDKIEIIYSFDRAYQLRNLRLVISPEEEVESITGDYQTAFLYENEIHDLFGIKFNHMTWDYQGNFIQVSEPAPWNPKK